MTHVNEFQILLSHDDWEVLGTVLNDDIEKIAFEFKQNNFGLKEVISGKYDVEHWKNEFNYKLLSISTNYGYVYTYYEKLDGVDIYQDANKDKVGYHFWFSYETESLMTRLFSLVDYIYHIVNIKYNLNVKEGLKFRKMVLSKLQPKNPSLTKFLRSTSKESSYKEAQKLRNEFSHNHSPLNLTSGLKKIENGFSLSNGEYIKPSEVMGIIDNFIALLLDMSIEYKKHI